MKLDLKSVTCPLCELAKTIKPFQYGMGVPGENDMYILAGCVSYPGAPEFGCTNCEWTGSTKDLIIKKVPIVKKDENALDLRIAMPKLEMDSQIHQAGIALINILAIDLFEFINRYFSKIKGKLWLNELKIKDISGKDFNLIDPSVLFKDLARNSQSILRQPINSVIEKENLKNFYDRLDEILGERNAWFHNKIKISAEQLESLVVLIYNIGNKLELSVVKECDELLKLLGSKTNYKESEIKNLDDEIEKSEILKEFEPLTKDEEQQIGSPISETFLDYTYTLHMNGSVRDRKTDRLLEEFYKGASTLGALLIARKPSGGRLRITNSGILAAYFNDDWGFIMKVNKENWFPGHLN